jgi:hypothetical protein
VREKNSSKDQRGWLVLDAARRQVIVASGPDGASIRVERLRTFPRSSLRNGNAEGINQKLHRVQPDRATPRKVRRRSSTATMITHSQNIR